jgi:hypothetical protein
MMMMMMMMMVIPAIPQLAEGIVADLLRDFWILETGMGQQVAQQHDRRMMMMMMMMMIPAIHFFMDSWDILVKMFASW